MARRCHRPLLPLCEPASSSDSMSEPSSSSKPARAPLAEPSASAPAQPKKSPSPSRESCRQRSSQAGSPGGSPVGRQPCGQDIGKACLPAECNEQLRTGLVGDADAGKAPSASNRHGGRAPASLAATELQGLPICRFCSRPHAAYHGPAAQPRPALRPPETNIAIGIISAIMRVTVAIIIVTSTPLSALSSSSSSSSSSS